MSEADCRYYPLFYRDSFVPSKVLVWTKLSLQGFQGLLLCGFSDA